MRADGGRRPVDSDHTADAVDVRDRDRTTHDRLRILRTAPTERETASGRCDGSAANRNLSLRRTAHRAAPPGPPYMATRLITRECPSKRVLESAGRVRDRRQP